jgi:hypothetical protein
VARFEVLPGLPPYGDWPEWVPATARGREGFVVRFTPDDGSEWVGNFAGGLSSFDHVCDHPNGRDVVVVAGGQAFVVDPATRALVESFGGQIEEVIPVPELGLLVFGNGLWFEALGPSGRCWTTRRLSWDGMRELRREGLRLSGEAWYPMAGGYWVPFEVNLASGECSGGSYEGPA